MQIRRPGLNLTISDTDGSIVALDNERRELVHDDRDPDGGARALFAIRLRGDGGAATDVSSTAASEFRAERREDEDGTTLLLHYAGFPGADLAVTVRVTCPAQEPASHWRLSVRNGTAMMVDWIDFPELVVPLDLPSDGGTSRLLWPAMEGVLVDDISYRESDWLRYVPVEYPNKGWEGYYPGPAPVQMMAYYNGDGGLYVAAHDGEFNVKTIEYFRHRGGIKLEFRLFPGGVTGDYEMPYDMVIRAFDGDWHDAADLYRAWRESEASMLPPKLVDNDELPDWLGESPITVVYPVRGQMHFGDMTPNAEYFPFANALPIMDRLAGELGGPLLALPMQWEGTAPWAPPYVWPPLGGEDGFVELVRGLHERGHYAGVYCSGIGWTNESGLLPEYDRTKDFEDDGLRAVMCDSPGDSPMRSNICQWPIRRGYDMCPAHPFTRETALGELEKIVASGCDYVQFFDQNLGGAPYFCYSTDHGHEPAPGRSQTEAMRTLMREMVAVAARSDREVAIGCESAAAEPYMEFLPFNDLRFEINYLVGRPVPLYAYVYVYHEYVNNFMGNQSATGNVVDFSRSPLNLLRRLAYSFVAGDMLTVVLADEGRIHWDWCTPWDVGKPDQQWVTGLVTALNAWRKNGAAQPFLRHGRMIRPLEVTGAGETVDVLRDGRELPWPAMLTSRWLSPDGRDAQMVVNYTPERRSFGLRSDGGHGNAVVRRDADDPSGAALSAERLRDGVEVAPLSAILIEFDADDPSAGSSRVTARAAGPARAVSVTSVPPTTAGPAVRTTRRPW